MEHRRLAPLWLSSVFVCLIGCSPNAAYAGQSLDSKAPSWNAVKVAEAPAQRSDRDVERKIMDPAALRQIMERFLHESFDVEEAEKILGPVANDSNPNSLTLDPKAESVERASLGMIDHDGTPFLSYMYLKFSGPVKIDLAPLIAAYGPVRKLPRLKPDQPTPHVFDVEGQDYSGGLMLGLEPGKGNLRLVRTIRFARFAAEAD